MGKFITITLETPALGGRRSAGGQQFTTSALEKNLALSDEKTQQAILSAIRDAGQEAKQFAVTLLAENVAADRREIEKRVKVEPVSVSRARGAVIITGKRIDLAHFRPVQHRQGVVVRTGKGEGSRFYKGAFGPNISRLGKGVFRRQTSKRLPIKKMRGLSLVSVARRTGIQEQIRIRFQYLARVKMKRNLVRVAIGIFREAA